ncbi:hypothetical protein [Piscirickettsia salmonis]|uniref:hypothetical protein n=1 Tax=Piscirickettsia salmonis TaxID=1238 RepID=UPI0012B83A57|nr:hypothetical protein [Piscirickettsia salmonis]QHS27629.1 hypothetical protein GW538_17280 [Piscirickettsia salmonis]QHS30834.1 hypothetical protein GW537_17425 [Piscirickettsia salmonis]QHS31105.1 hypothetical protein GW537_19130 [Piscirickettsia salmonis]
MLGDFASLDVQNTYRGSDAYVHSKQRAQENNLSEAPYNFSQQCLNFSIDGKKLK